MKALVTGASGFVGRHLVGSLSSAGHEVHAVLRSGSSRWAPSGAGVVEHRLAEPNAEVGAIIQAERPAVVFHLATHFAARHQASEIVSMLNANVTFGTIVAQACAETGSRLVHATSAWQHYQGADYAPVSLYAATKQALVDIVEYFRLVEGLDAREVCLFDTYGPDDDRGKLISALLDAADSGREMNMSSGTQLVDLVHISDVVAALLMAGETDQFGTRMVVRTAAPLTVRGVAAVVEEISGKPLAINWGSRPDRGREMVSDWSIKGDNLGWTAKTSLSDGLAQLWQQR